MRKEESGVFCVQFVVNAAVGPLKRKLTQSIGSRVPFLRLLAANGSKF